MIELRCRSGKGCVSATPDGAALISQAGGICHGCIADIQKRLDQLPSLVDILGALKGSWGGSSGEARVSGSNTPQAPLNVSLVDLVDEIGDVVDRTEGYRIVDLVTQPAQEFLIWGSGGVALAELDGVHRALDVRRIHTQAEKAAGVDRVWQRRAAGCPDCHMPTLGSWLGEDTVSCTNSECLSRFTRTEYENHCFKTSQSEKGKKKTHA